MRQPPKFRPAFNNAEEVRDLIRRRINERNAKPRPDRIEREQVFEAGRNLLRGVDVGSSLRCIYRWKLGSFVRRFKWVKAFPEAVSERVLNKAISLARKAVKNPSDKNIVRAAIEASKDIHGVRVPVASAFLTAMDREQFTIIDRQAYKALGVKFRDGTSEYLEYL